MKEKFKQIREKNITNDFLMYVWNKDPELSHLKVLATVQQIQKDTCLAVIEEIELIANKALPAHNFSQTFFNQLNELKKQL